MAEATLKCDVFDGDQIRAEVAASGNRVALSRWDDGRQVGDDVFATPTTLRAFVRRLLELADEVDGGEAKPADTRPKVGDRLQVREDHPRYCPVAKGDVITVVATDYGHDGEDCVRFQHGDDTYQWFIPLAAVAPLAAWEVDLLEASTPETAPLAPKVGDRVRVVRNAFDYEGDENVGDVGTLTRIDAGDEQPYGVVVDGGDSYPWWCAEVELVVDEPEPSPVPRVPVVSMRGDFVKQAKELLAGTDHDAADIVRLAEFLAAE